MIIVDFIIFGVLFLGGFWLLGIAHEAPTAPGLLFTAGILLVSIALAYVMRARGSATRRSKSWEN